MMFPNIHQKSSVFLILLCVIYLLAACNTAIDAPPAMSTDEAQSEVQQAAMAEESPTVHFVDLADGANVDAPMHIKMAVENLTLEAAGEPKAGHGHLHIMVNEPCVTPGEVIIKDGTHLHYGQGQSETMLELLPGNYSLCLQAADGAHRALAATDEVQITVAHYTGPRTFFVDPSDGATVPKTFKVKMAVENLTLEAAGEPKAGHGHLHITVDGECTLAGEIVIKDETHIHYGQGQSEAELTLTPGEHQLCLQVADGAHQALAGAFTTQQIKLTVE